MTASMVAQDGPAHVGNAECRCELADCLAVFRGLHALPVADAARRQLRNQLVEAHLGLVRRITGRFRSRGVPAEDLRQVAAVALVQAVDRFDPERGTPFHAFAVPTVLGTLKKYLRDYEWVVDVPRRLKDLRREVCTASDELTQRFGRAPTRRELAAELSCPSEDIVEALKTHDAFQPLSLDAPVSDADDETRTLGTELGSTDNALEMVEYDVCLGPLLQELPVREQQALLLRFFGNLSQVQIAAEIGCSQMHVSRLLRRALDQLRYRLTTDGPVTARTAGQPLWLS